MDIFLHFLSSIEIMLFHKIFATFVLCMLVSCSNAAPEQATLEMQVDQLMARAYTGDKPGAAAVVIRGNAQLLRKAYGLSDIGQARALTPETEFRIGSITKQFTAAAILLLDEQGKLKLDDPIGKFLPELPPKLSNITIEQLLTHTSGIANFTSQPDYFPNMANPASLASMIKRIGEYPVLFSPGSRFDYSNSNYVLLGAMIERLGKKPYAQFMADSIFQPLGMDHTAFEGAERTRGVRAIGYSVDAQGFIPSRPISMTQPHAAGALVSTVDDLVRWSTAIRTTSLLTGASWKRATAPARLNDGSLSHYGYGFELGTLHGARRVAHGGAINGFTGYFLTLPDEEITVIVLSNADGGIANPHQLANEIAGLVLGLQGAHERSAQRVR